MVDGIGDEEGGEDVYGIMKMTEEDTCAKEKRSENENSSQFFVVPKNKAHKERQAGMGREEHIIAGGNIAKRTVRFQIGMNRRQAEVGEGDESRSNENKKSNAFYGEGNFLRIAEKEKGDKRPKQSKTLKKYKIYIDYRNIIKNYVCHGIASMIGGIDISVIIDNKADS